MAAAHRTDGTDEQGAGSMTFARYWLLSRRPLQILVFLLPLVVAYEVALISVLRAEAVNIEAHKQLRRVFEAFGIYPAGWYLPGLLLVIVLLVWHLLTRERWRIDGRALGLMLIESIVLVFPLFMLSQAVGHLAAAAVEGATDIGQYSVTTRLAISIGAGLYEELIFRMLIIAVIHAIMVDVAKASERWGAAAGVVLSAVLFTIYHPDLTAPRVVFFFLAGLYFGVIYLWRGFGIVVATHALYDVVTVLTMSD